MKKILLIISLLSTSFLALPVAALAHGEASGDADFGMMRFIEDQALGDELHEEMESLMVNMMAGTLTDAESERLVELMRQYPGPQAMMASRLVGMRYGGDQASRWPQGMMGGYNMMSWGGGFGGFWMLFAWLGSLIWLTVGVLAVVWLWKQITK